MCILIHDFGGYSFTLQLALELQRSCDCVKYVSLKTSRAIGFKHLLAYSRKGPGYFRKKELDIGCEYDKANPFRRLLQEVKYGRLFQRVVKESQPSVVISANSPLVSQQRTVRFCRNKGIPFIFWLQDLRSLAASLILTKRYGTTGKLLARAFSRLEHVQLRNSDAVISVTEDFDGRLDDIGVPENNRWVIHNWATVDQFAVMERDNNWCREHDLQSKFCFLHAGTLGHKHRSDLLIALARHFKKNDWVRVVVVAEGAGVQTIRKAKLTENLNNLLILEFQPSERLSEILATANVLVTTLKETASTYSVPSRVLTYLCAGRPILAAIPESNLASRIISHNNAGMVVSPSNVPKFLTAANELFTYSAMLREMGRNARQLAEHEFAIGPIKERFKEVIHFAVDRARR